MEKDFNIRYARQIAVPEIGEEGQRKLSDSKVLVIGCGALGSMVVMQLAGAGIGTIGISDFDTIDISNLQRQFFFTVNEAGEDKCKVLEKRIHALNPEIKILTYPVIMTAKKAENLFGEYDFIIDATDNPATKKMIGKVSKEKGKACCIAGVRNFGGQVMTFLPDEPRFEDYFGSGEDEGFLPCSLGGVMGPAAALCASIQASEAIKYLVGNSSLLNGRILLFDLLKPSFKIIPLI